MGSVQLARSKARQLRLIVVLPSHFLMKGWNLPCPGGSSIGGNVSGYSSQPHLLIHSFPREEEWLTLGMRLGERLWVGIAQINLGALSYLAYLQIRTLSYVPKWKIYQGRLCLERIEAWSLRRGDWFIWRKSRNSGFGSGLSRVL